MSSLPVASSTVQPYGCSSSLRVRRERHGAAWFSSARSGPSCLRLFFFVATAELSDAASPEVFDRSEALKVIPEKKKGIVGELGVLYKYATKSQILCCGNEEEVAERDDESSMEVSEHYLDCIERSLDTLAQTGLNPFLM